MSGSKEPCTHLIDVPGLRTICQLSDNEKKIMLGKLYSGEIRMLAVVWKEFKTIFPELVGEFDEKKLSKINMKPDYDFGAAVIADHVATGFQDRTYDENTDLFTASAAMAEGHTVATGSDGISFYEQIDDCVAEEISSLVE